MKKKHSEVNPPLNQPRLPQQKRAILSASNLLAPSEIEQLRQSKKTSIAYMRQAFSRQN